MLSGSHLVPTKLPSGTPLKCPGLLADAFSDFIAAASQLEASYRDLQREVTHLASELAERKAALARSVAEADRMRNALQQMLEAMPCDALVLDAGGTIIMLNAQVRELLNLGNAPVKTLRDLAATGNVDFEQLSCAVEDATETEVAIIREGMRQWVAVGFRKVCSAPVGQELQRYNVLPIQSIWTVRDITASKHAEQERESARNAMALAEVSTILAHEIRNPLASMELFAGLILQDRDSDPGPWINHLRAGIRILSATVNNVLRMHGGGSPCLVPLNLATAAGASVEFVMPIAEQAGVGLTFASADESLMILGNEESVRQIVLNLVCNAIRRSRPGGKIAVTSHCCQHDGKMFAVVRVADNGCGIPEAFLDQLFELGFSISGDTPGLGLAVCRNLMGQHGGAIRVSSRVHQGTTFCLEFPVL
jgi:signal transduction histidine kinase